MFDYGDEEKKILIEENDPSKGYFLAKDYNYRDLARATEDVEDDDDYEEEVEEIEDGEAEEKPVKETYNVRKMVFENISEFGGFSIKGAPPNKEEIDSWPNLLVQKIISRYFETFSALKKKDDPKLIQAKKKSYPRRR